MLKHGNKTERIEIRVDSFDKMYLTAIANKKGCSVGRLLRDMIQQYKVHERSKMTDEEYKGLLDYMLMIAQ